MSDASGAPLQFETAGPAAGAACGSCQQAIAGSYFTVGTQVTCERCKTDIELGLQQSPGASAFLRAILYGSLWGLLGATAWWAVRVFAGYEVGLIAVGIGYFVGRSVQRACGGRGGLRFRVLAVALTYFWIAANYVPDIVSELASANESSTEVAGESAEAAPAELAFT